MRKLHRIEIGNKLLEELYDNNCNLSDEQITTLFYNFLVNEGNGVDFFTQSTCFDYELEPQEMEIYKQDMILEILAKVYEFLSYGQATFDEFPELEEEILSDLNTIPFSVKNLIEYFRNPIHMEKVRKILLNYFIYMTQDEPFADDCKDYNYGKATPFYDRIIRTIKYIEVSDVLLLINEEVFENYHSEEEEDEEEEFDDYDEDELEEYAIASIVAQMDYEEKYHDFDKEYQEVYEKILDYLNRIFCYEKELMSDFIGFFMSYVYAFLAKVYEEGSLSLEDEEMISMFLKPNLTIEYVIEMFLSSKEFLAYSVELFSQEYYRAYGDIYSIRENYSTPFDNKIFKLLDPYYEAQNKNFVILYSEEPIVKAFNQILCKMKEKYPENYVDEIYQLLSNPEYDCSIFEDFNLDLENIYYYQKRMMRYLSRKYVEECSLKPLVDFSIEELFLYQGLMHADSTDKNIASIMDKGYSYLISNYFGMLEKGPLYEKNIIRQLREKNALERLTLIDPSCMTDDVYLKALNQSEFFNILETYGVQYTIGYLRDLKNRVFPKCYEYLKELLMCNYYYAKKGIYKDWVTESVIRELEDREYELKSYSFCLLADKTKVSLLEELLQRYLDQETTTEYSLSYKEKLEGSPKVKQFLYPDNKIENR